MSRFLSRKYEGLRPYVPGEQPKQGERFIKLNTNENPYPPSPKAQAMANEAAAGFRLYSDPECCLLRETIAAQLGLSPAQILCGNGSDEILDLLFLTFCDEERPAAFPDITYGLYRVLASLYGVPFTEIPLREDFSFAKEDYLGIGRNIFIANPNAPTSVALPAAVFGEIADANPDHLVVVDEAYVDFGAESCIPLLKDHPNLVVVQTFSKSRSMAGARLGFAAASEEIIAEMNAVRDSRNPYNINSATLAAGIGAMLDREYMLDNCRKITETREMLTEELKKMGFRVLPSSANFVFVSHPTLSGGELYRRLKGRGILVRYFDTPRLRAFTRITVGSPEETGTLLTEIKAISEEEA